MQQGHVLFRFDDRLIRDDFMFWTLIKDKEAARQLVNQQMTKDLRQAQTINTATAAISPATGLCPSSHQPTKVSAATPMSTETTGSRTIVAGNDTSSEPELPASAWVIASPATSSRPSARRKSPARWD